MTSLSGNSGSVENDNDTFFSTVKPPEHFQHSVETAEEFIKYNHNIGRPIVLVTSGGTTVPLEKKMVRFLDNFSAGTRGAISAEWFLKKGFAVIFLHRQYSLQPFSRHYRHADELVLDMFEVPSENGPQLIVKPQYRDKVSSDVKTNHNYRNTTKSLVSIHFYTVTDYLYLLQQLCKLLNRAGSNVIVFLAAAVSDFYLPESKLSENKIQSDEGALVLKLEPVPKLIKPIVKFWCPRAFIVSFKLETDPSLLISKSLKALDKYKHHVVVANLLSERRTKVQIIRPPPTLPEALFASNGIEIEESIVNKIIDLWKGYK